MYDLYSILGMKLMSLEYILNILHVLMDGPWWISKMWLKCDQKAPKILFVNDFHAIKVKYVMHWFFMRFYVPDVFRFSFFKDLPIFPDS